MVALPAIVISAFDRPRSLERLLGHLSKGIFSSPDIPLVISIDGGGDDEVLKLATEFEWSHGAKEVIHHSTNLGLKEHIISCGDLTSRFGQVIVLEDDLGISPFFYEFALKSIATYADSEEVAGISLYAYKVSENGFDDFLPIDDGKDVYLMQIASSWGQIWTESQWSGFRSWMGSGGDMDKLTPDYLDGWSDRSWKKLFIKYLIQKDKWFVFPRVSLTTNYEDAGEHSFNSGRFLVPMVQGEKQWEFPAISEIRVRYDAWFKPTAQTLEVYKDVSGQKLNETTASDSTFSINVDAEPISGLEQTLQSIAKQSWSAAIVYVQVNDEQSLAAKELCKQHLDSSVTWKILVDHTEEELIKRSSISDFVVSVNSGDIFCENALSSVATVFDQIPNLAMVCGMLESGNTIDHRWNAERYLIKARNGEQVPTLSAVFRKVHTMEGSTEYPSMLSALKKFQMHLVAIPLVIGQTSDDHNEVIKTSLDGIEYSRPWWKRALTTVVGSFAPDSELYTFVSGLPDVIRYDHVHGTYYLSRS